MADEKVKIKYTDSSLAAKHGAAAFETSLHLALEYEAKGLAVILNRPPSANPSPSPAKLREEQEKQRAAYMAEQELLTKISWITPTYVDRTLLKVGETLGFKVEVQTPTLFSIHRILTAELLVIESNYKGFSHNQLVDIRAAQFQKEKPFIFRVTNYESTDAYQQNLMRAKLVVFTHNRLLDNAKELYGDLFSNYFVEGEDDWYVFWKKVDEVIKPAPVAVEETISLKIAVSSDSKNLSSPLSPLLNPEGKEEPAKITLEDLQNFEKMCPPPEDDDAWMDDIIAETTGKKK